MSVSPVVKMTSDGPLDGPGDALWHLMRISRVSGGSCCAAQRLECLQNVRACTGPTSHSLLKSVRGLRSPLRGYLISGLVHAARTQGKIPILSVSAVLCKGLQGACQECLPPRLP